MYWMLLPLDADARRHHSTCSSSPTGVWAHWFRAALATIVHILRPPRS
jgi:hypothetical protein